MSEWPPRPWPEAEPLFVTPRNPNRETLVDQLVEVSRNLGYEPMPWNIRNWETMYEYVPVETPNGITKKLWYREARITVPRQSAKTTGTLIRHVHRCVYARENGWLRPGERSTCAFTMQHQSDASKKVLEVWHPVLEQSIWAQAHYERLRKGAGQIGVKWANGSTMGVFAPNMTGAHGDTLDQVDIDEAFAFPDDRPEQGARPAMITRLSPQVVVQSTQGTMDSSYFNSKCDDGRKHVRRQRDGEDTHVYYLEYACGPGDDINNPEHWPRWMPALGYTIQVDDVMIEKETLDGSEEGPNAFLRAYGNVKVGTAHQIIPADRWANCYAPKSFRDGKVWMAVDASPGKDGHGRSGSIAVASFRGDKVAIEVIRHGPGIMWIPEAIGELTRQHRVQQLWLDPIGPIGSIRHDIKQKAMANIVDCDHRTMVNACARFHQGVLDSKIEHRDQQMLNAAVQGAAKRSLDDGWAWKRATSSSDISPLVACTLAHWAAVFQGDRGLIGMATAK
jgi:phage terminase large subunit-like protein